MPPLTAPGVFPLSLVSLFQGLDAPQLWDVQSCAHRTRLNRGAFLFQAGEQADALYILIKGQVRVVRDTASGQRNILHIAHPGDVLGCAVLAGATCYPGSAEVIEEGIALKLGIKTLEQLTQKYPQLNRNAMALMLNRIEDLRGRVQDLALQPVEQRLGKVLVELSRPDPTGAYPRLRLSRQDLADFVGSTQFTVSRWLHLWEAQGWLHSGRGWFQLIRPVPLSAVDTPLPLAHP